jgi:hypothetical protein
VGGFAGGTDSGPATLGFSTNHRRYYQQVLPVNTEVYALGSAQPREGDWGAGGDLLKLTREPGHDEFLISDLSEA